MYPLSIHPLTHFCSHSSTHPPTYPPTHFPTGLVDTDIDWTVTMEQTPLGGLSEEKVEERIKRVPLGRGGGEEEGKKR